MPEYTYECEQHGRFARHRRVDLRNVPAVCAQCGQSAPRRYHAPGLVFRGSGFYQTDKVLDEPPNPRDYDPLDTDIYNDGSGFTVADL